MSRIYQLENQEEFERTITSVLASGVKPEDINTLTPLPVPGLEERLGRRRSATRFFALAGAIAGLLTGFGLTIYTVLSWPLNTGGKPLISIPAFIIIAFELSILIGAVTSFIGFLLLSGLPSLRAMIAAQEFSDKYIISVEPRGSDHE